MRWFCEVVKVIGLFVRLLMVVAISVDNAYLMGMIANSSLVSSGTSTDLMISNIRFILEE